MLAGDSESFDLPTLLKQSGLCLRHFAASEPLFPAAEYFCMLTKILRFAPDVSTALVKFATCDPDRDACKSINIMTTLLERLGCDEFALDFHSLLDTYGKKGNWRKAAIYAKRIKQDFDKFCSHIMTARELGAQSSGAPSEASLKELIERLDTEEAHRKLLVLAVDDSLVILKSISAVLNDTYKVYVLPKPTRIKDVLKTLTPELFLLDYKMPEITGFELVPIIRSFEEHKETPIIFLTSAGTIENVSAALALGASDFIVKPFKPDILREKIARHIVRKKAF